MTFLYLFDAKGETRASLNVLGDSGPGLRLLDAQEKTLVALGHDDNGGHVNLDNKTGESIATIYADEYGNGVVGAWNRKGMGRTLTPGP